MIYAPNQFRESRRDIVRDIICRYNFGTLISLRDSQQTFSHLPFLYESDHGEHGTLVAHMARANPQWRGFDGDAKATAIFVGPHAYVSPRWYAPQPGNVPTWNYAVVHAHGVPRVISDANAAYETMEKLVQRHDPDWSLVLSRDDRQDLMRSIVVFEIQITSIDAKLKLSQNRSRADRVEVATQLQKGQFEIERQTGRLMQDLMTREE